MREIVIKVSNVSMSFRLAHEKVETLKEYMIRLVKRKLAYSEFTALKSINLDIYKGERLGIIGHNGAGKSTLLKLISGIMKPTEGIIEVSGLISPLLELGAGFDPEFSGAENIFLNGAILGKSKDFLENKYDEIVDFADLGEFIDVPIKNYSSGMRAKLGFSIASQIDPDILIVDEVLGVGDMVFRRKSSEKIQSLMSGGRTVILVSHNLKQVEDLTDRIIWLDHGEIREIGDSKKVCNNYREFMNKR